MEKLGKVVDGNLRFSEVKWLSEDNIKYLISDGYKEIIYTDKPIISGLQGIKKRYEELEDKIILYYDIVEYDTYKVNIEINRLKKLLTDTDYKFLKFQEGVLTEEEYAPTKQQRIGWRKEINELETYL